MQGMKVLIIFIIENCIVSGYSVRRRSAPVHQEAAESVFIVWDGSGYVCVDRDLTEILGWWLFV